MQKLWTSEEDKILLEQRRVHGPAWRVYYDPMMTGQRRSIDACERRLNFLRRRHRPVRPTPDGEPLRVGDDRLLQLLRQHHVLVER